MTAWVKTLEMTLEKKLYQHRVGYLSQPVVRKPSSVVHVSPVLSKCIVVVCVCKRELGFKHRIGELEAVCGKCQMLATTGVRCGCLLEDVCCSDASEV